MSPVYKFSNVGGFLTKNLYTSALAGNSAVVLDQGSIYPLGVFTLASAQQTVSFTNIPSTYTHLQLRINMLTGTGGQVIQMRFNGDSVSNYTLHALRGNGSAASPEGAASQSTIVVFGRLVGTSTTNPSVAVTDILDYKNTNKNKTVKTLSGMDANGSGEVNFISGVWMNSSTAINSIELSPYNGAISFAANSSFALYGVL